MRARSMLKRRRVVSKGTERKKRRSKGLNGTWRCLGEQSGPIDGGQSDPSDLDGMSTLWAEAFDESVAMAMAVVEEWVDGQVIGESLQVLDSGMASDARAAVM